MSKENTVIEVENTTNAVITSEEAPETKPNEYRLSRKLVSEYTGTMLLVSSVVGSGIMGDELSLDDGVTLLGNTLSTIGSLYILINVFGNISGAHFNPVVSTMVWFKNGITNKELACYVPCQIIGGISGTALAHVMFGYQFLDVSTNDRDTGGEFLSEIVATFGLLTVLSSYVANGRDINEIATAVSMYIMSGYWFTHSTCFANPAITVARTFTNTYTGISFKSWPNYLFGQLFGLIFALPFYEWVFNNKTFIESVKVLKKWDNSEE